MNIVEHHVRQTPQHCVKVEESQKDLICYPSYFVQRPTVWIVGLSKTYEHQTSGCTTNQHFFSQVFYLPNANKASTKLHLMTAMFYKPSPGMFQLQRMDVLWTTGVGES